MTKKGKWKGFDLVRKETNPEPSPKAPPASSNHSSPQSPVTSGYRMPTSSSSTKNEPQSRLGRIRTRRIMQGPDGEVVNLTEIYHVWLVQMDEINQLFISDVLKSHGYEVTECKRIDLLPSLLTQTEETPKLIVIEARAVGQQTPFFRKMLLPKMQEANITCLLTGVANAAQEASFRRWYDGPLLVGGDLDLFTETVTQLIGKAPR